MLVKTFNFPLQVNRPVRNNWNQIIFCPGIKYTFQGWLTPDGGLLQVSDLAIPRGWLEDAGAEIQNGNGDWVPLKS